MPILSIFKYTTLNFHDKSSYFKKIKKGQNLDNYKDLELF